MKLDVNALRYLSREEFRTLQAVEVGQRNVRALLCLSVCSQSKPHRLLRLGVDHVLIMTVFGCSMMWCPRRLLTA